MLCHVSHIRRKINFLYLYQYKWKKNVLHTSGTTEIELTVAGQKKKKKKKRHHEKYMYFAKLQLVSNCYTVLSYTV